MISLLSLDLCCADTIKSDADFDPSFDLSQSNLRLHNTAELLFKSSQLIHLDRE